MKGFLLDENVPYRLTFTPSLPIIHSSDLGQSLSATSLWEYAHRTECVIVTKDADFTNRIMLSSPPPWIVHLRIANMRKRDFHSFLAQIWGEIERLPPLHKLAIVYADRIEAMQ